METESSIETTMNRLKHVLGLTLAVTGVALPATSLLAPATAAAQQTATARNLIGEVVDKGGNKVKGAVVHLKDTRSLSQRSYITLDDGTFRFNQLSPSTDYEVWADLDGKKSPSKSISSFDSKKAIDVSLKMPD